MAGGGKVITWSPLCVRVPVVESTERCEQIAINANQTRCVDERVCVCVDLESSFVHIHTRAHDAYTVKSNMRL